MFNSKVYLVQTDTTVGFLSKSYKKLNSIKNRDIYQKNLQEVDSFKTLQSNTRVPNKFKKYIRNSKNSSFIYPNLNSYRVIPKNSKHQNFINKFNILYSTSANKTKKYFDEDFASNASDIIIFDNNKFKENNSSTIYKITKNKIKKIR